MQSIHSTTTHIMTYVRIVGILALAFLFVTVIPFFVILFADFLRENIVYMGILYAIIVGFLMSIAIDRKRVLDEYISLELNKIRRINHLGSHLAKAQPRLNDWYEELRGHLIAYSDLFKEVSFHVYERGNDLFRGVTYTIYKLPTLKLPYNAELYRSLLDAAASATEARENIRSKKDQNIGHFQWLVIIIITLTFAWLIITAAPPTPNARIVSAIIVFNIFLVLELLFEYDTLNDKKLRQLADQYAHNMDSIDSNDVGRSRKKKR